MNGSFFPLDNLTERQKLISNNLTQTIIIVILQQECNRHTLMKYFDWNDEKNEILKKTRGVSFEQVELAIALGDLIDRVKHPNSAKYPNQKVFLITHLYHLNCQALVIINNIKLS